MNTSLESQGENLLRSLMPQVLATLIRRYGHFPAAEDAVQEALLAAFVQWPKQGVPKNPRGWLLHVASRRMQDYFRAELARRQRETVVAAQEPRDRYAASPADEDPLEQEDDTLILLFMCAHPSLTRSSAIALTLRAVGGLTTAEIARAYMVPEATMAQRISRAKQRIKASGIPFRLPSDEKRKERLATVLHVLYLMFNEGYAGSYPTRRRIDLSNEAIRLARLLHSFALDDGEVAGLLALMLLTDARRAARLGESGELIPLAKQDRTLWDRRMMAEGIQLLTEALSRGSIGPYQLQAAIAAVHNEATRAEDTDWPQIVALYRLLMRMSSNPMLTLNHAVAVAMVHGPAAGLALLKPLDADKRLATHHRLAAVRAHLFEEMGEREKAVTHYALAATRTRNILERNYLLRQVARLTNGSTAHQRPAGK